MEDNPVAHVPDVSRPLHQLPGNGQEIGLHSLRWRRRWRTSGPQFTLECRSARL